MVVLVYSITKYGLKQLLPHILSCIYYFFEFGMTANLTGVRWNLILVFICISLMAIDPEHVFMTEVICIPSFEKCLYVSLAHFLIGVFVLLLSSMSSLWMLNINPFIRFIVCKCFHPFCQLHLYFDECFIVETLLAFISISDLLACARSLPKPMYYRLCLFSSSKLMASGCRFRSLSTVSWFL